ncbi:hypothetical protein AB0H49_10950 [Nocardia sp. NPDC050713]|uniref:hypothetical protein n=1 Tax=Nocardia sp. NPDC050713 TaxID=3154511 RepID=UPI00340F53C2
MTDAVVVDRFGNGLETAFADGRPIAFVCGDIYRGGCDKIAEPPGWLHADEWIDWDGRHRGPHLEAERDRA